MSPLPGFIGLIGLLLAVPQPAVALDAAAPPVRPDAVSAAAPAKGSAEAPVLKLVNKARAHKRKCGSTSYAKAKPVRWNATLAAVAAAHSADMAANGYFSHSSLNGDSPFTRITAAGYHYRAAGENIAAGYASASAVMKGWLKSPGHCKNIMSKSFTQLGVGYVKGGNYGSYWTQDFAKPAK